MAASKPGRLMRFEARRTYPAEPSIVRALLTDPSVLRQIIPGCESLRLLESGEFALTLALRIGQSVRQFNGHLAQADTESGDTFMYHASSESHGEKLTGKYNGQFGSADLTGTVKGNAIQFSFTIDVQGQQAPATYKGTIEKATMKGTMDIGGMVTGTFTAKKK